METVNRRSARKRQTLRARVKHLAAAVVIAALGLGGFVATTVPASAASAGVGWGEFNQYGNYHGTFNVNGTMVFCIDPAGPLPSGQTSDGGIIGSWGSLSANQMAGINRVMQENANTGDRNQAAGASFAIQSVVDYEATIAGSGGSYRNNGYPYGRNLDGVIRWELYSSAGAGNVATVQRVANNLVGVINSTTAAPSNAGSGSLAFDVDPHNNFRGSVRMVGTPGSSGTINLANGVFVATGNGTLNGAQEGVWYEITGVPPQPGHPADPSGTPFQEGGAYKIWGSGSFSFPSSGYTGTLRVWWTAGQQVLGSGGAAPQSSFNVSGEDPAYRATDFGPVVTTTAQTYVQAGQAFTDVLRFSTQADSNGLNNPWTRFANGNYLPITANGTLYGPYSAQPARSATVPAGAPVASTATVTTGAQGPEIGYTATSAGVATQSGFYTWVWEIDRASQAPLVQNYLFDGYRFQDEFGIVAETSIVPSRISAVTAITAESIPLSGLSQDRLTVSSDGRWLENTQGRVPVTFHGEAYYVPGSNPPSRVPSHRIPAQARSLGTTNIVATGPGTYTSDTIRVPAAGEGYVTWVWKVRPEDQPEATRGWVVPWSDDFGIPAETQQLLQPEVTTQATYHAPSESEITDTATVDGTLPANGAELTFEAYNVPMVEVEVPIGGTPDPDAPAEEPADPNAGDDGEEPDAGEDPEPIETITTVRPDYPTLEAEAEKDLSWACTPANRIFSNAADGTLVDANGDYVSPAFIPEERGIVLWVESLWSVPFGSEARQRIAQGDCGAKNETSHIFDVQTLATDGQRLGGEIKDTAEVTGPLPVDGVELTFAAYRLPTTVDENGNPVPAAPMGPEPEESATPTESPSPEASDDPPAAPDPDDESGAEPPVDVSWACTPENLLFENTESGQVITDPGEYVSPSFAPEQHDIVLWVESLWTVPAAGEERALITQGECGVLDETSYVVDLTTEATAGAALGGDIHDTATVTGALPLAGANLSFEAFEVPLVEGADGVSRADYPTEADAATGDLAWACTPETRVFGNTDDPQVITAPGIYDSPSFAPERHAMILWIETLRTFDDRILAQGACGVPEETSYLVDIATRAQISDGNGEAEQGSELWDVATVNGYLPSGGTIEFQAYVIPKSVQGGELSAACTPETLAWTSAPVPTEGGLVTDLIVTGERWSNDVAYDSTLYWVEVTKDALGRTVSEGECGDPSETVGLKGKRTATVATGGEMAPMIALGAALIATGALLIFVYMRRRRPAGAR